MAKSSEATPLAWARPAKCRYKSRNIQYWNTWNSLSHHLTQHIIAIKKASSQHIDAQLVFCIDVRSEPFRRAIEAQGHYETCGFAGFFGIPVSIENEITGKSYHSCPVLLKPAHHVKESPVCGHHAHEKGHSRKISFKRLYQSLKYNFATPFALVETIGPASGLWMALRSLAPRFASKI